MERSKLPVIKNGTQAAVTAELKEFLDIKADLYNRPGFTHTDPVSIPHQFTKKEDIELAAFLVATIAWGQRPVIIKNASLLMQGMDLSPSAFIRDAATSDLSRFKHFVHRTFNGEDCILFIRCLKKMLLEHGSLGAFFEKSFCDSRDLREVLIQFRSAFFAGFEPGRSAKHLADVAGNASAKRLNMYLRWMVRNDKRGVDFGLWKKIPASALYIPLDVHSAAVARKLGLLHRSQNDWKAVEELTLRLRQFDPIDPVKYDFALFGLGVFEKWELARP
ncbi:MAG: TIGR02757 family protein [Bacteroidales bacterium]